jgi:hypothetical protein
MIRKFVIQPINIRYQLATIHSKMGEYANVCCGNIRVASNAAY